MIDNTIRLLRRSSRENTFYGLLGVFLILGGHRREVNFSSCPPERFMGHSCNGTDQHNPAERYPRLSPLSAKGMIAFSSALPLLTLQESRTAALSVVYSVASCIRAKMTLEFEGFS